MTGAVIMADDPSQVKPGSQVTVVTGTEFSVNAPPASATSGATGSGASGTPTTAAGAASNTGSTGSGSGSRVEQRRLPATDVDGLAAGSLGPPLVYAERGRGDLSRSTLGCLTALESPGSVWPVYAEDRALPFGAYGLPLILRDVSCGSA